MRRCLPAAAILVATLACSLDSRVLAVSDASAPPEGVLLLSDGQGFFDGSNAAGIMGYWYVNSDAIAPGSSCLDVGFSAAQCSTIATPPHDGYAFAVPDPSRICTSGLVAKVIANPSTMALDYEHIWGTNIGLDFNNPNQSNLNGGSAYDAPAHGITGFSFVIDAPPSTVRISFTADANSYAPAYWGGGTDIVSPVHPGLNVVRWADVGGPMYLAKPPAFDPSALLGIQFMVVPNDIRPVPFDYCVSSLTALTE